MYGTLPRAGPGGDGHTDRALALALAPGPPPRSVLDLGCGPGAQTLALARALADTPILAVDLEPSMVAETRRRTVAAGLGDRVLPVVGDMAEPPTTDGGHDLIWCEGAIYNLGVTEALRAWRPLLSPRGVVAFTEPVWLDPSPPAEVSAWWEAEYPPLTDGAGVQARIEAADHETIDWFALPPTAWWDEYYQPMGDRIDQVRAHRADDPVAAAITAMAEKEIDMCRRFGDYYTYVFFITRPSTGPGRR